jgi:hypothetical protein
MIGPFVRTCQQTTWLSWQSSAAGILERSTAAGLPPYRCHEEWNMDPAGVGLTATASSAQGQSCLKTRARLMSRRLGPAVVVAFIAISLDHGCFVDTESVLFCVQCCLDTNGQSQLGISVS